MVGTGVGAALGVGMVVDGEATGVPGMLVAVPVGVGDVAAVGVAGLVVTVTVGVTVVVGVAAGAIATAVPAGTAPLIVRYT